MTTKNALDGFTKDELARFEALLLDRRRLLLSDLRTLEEDAADAASDTSMASSHLADFGSDIASSDLNLGRRASESTEIQEIDDAIDRIHEGSFGRCETCEKMIAKERLEAIPYARLCLPCKKEEEN